MLSTPQLLSSFNRLKSSNRSFDAILSSVECITNECTVHTVNWKKRGTDLNCIWPLYIVPMFRLVQPTANTHIGTQHHTSRTHTVADRKWVECVTVLFFFSASYVQINEATNHHTWARSLLKSKAIFLPQIPLFFCWCFHVLIFFPWIVAEIRFCFCCFFCDVVLLFIKHIISFLFFSLGCYSLKSLSHKINPI